MKKHCLLVLLLLASCAGQSQGPNLAEQPADTGKYHADLVSCQQWAAPTQHEFAKRCEAQGDMVMVAHIIDAFSHDDPRDRDTERQSMPNNSQYRLNMCMKAKGYKIDLPGNAAVIKTAER